jgi:DNA modification methylase
MKKAARWIDYMPLVDVEGATRNPKKHAAGIADAIGRFGYADGVILDERTGRLVAGHGRVETLRAMEAAGETPPDGVEVSKAGWLLPVQRGWSSRSDKEAEAFLVAHNRLTEEGGWDDVALLELLDQFDDEELAGMGVDEAYLDELAERVDELSEPEIPEGEDAGAGEPPADPVSQRGEIYALGPHRIMCGDSTSAEDVEALLGGEKADLVWTDPPYGVAIGANGGSLGKRQNDNSRTIANDNLGFEGTEDLWSKALGEAAKATKPGAVCYAACPIGDMLPSVLSGYRSSGFVFSSLLVWVKDRFALGRGDMHRRHEGILYGWKRDAAHYFTPERTHDDVFEIPRPSRSEDHPTMKPPELIEQHLSNSSKTGWIVYDPFLGSGTTLIAAAKTGRTCYGMEISPAYCDVIRKRWGDWARSAKVDAGPDAL